MEIMNSVHFQKLKNLLQVDHPPETTVQRASSVLLLIAPMGTAASPGILLTRRTQWVHTHKGQVSLPGGLFEASDPSLLATALRETQEEVGIQTEGLEILGALPTVDTTSSFRIFPWVGRSNEVLNLNVNPQEVERAFFLPLEILMNQGFNVTKIPIEGIFVHSPALEWEGETIWGATARILQSFRELCLKLL